MMSSMGLALAAALCVLGETPSAPAPAPAPAPAVTLLVLDPEVDGDTRIAGSIAGAVARTLSTDPRAKVFTAADVKQLAEMAATQQAGGCDSSSCLSEIGDALGARWVIFGSTLRLAGELELELRLFDVKLSEVVARERIAAADEAALVERAPVAAKNLVREILPPPPFFERPGVLPTTLVLGAGVVVAAGAGTGTALLESAAKDATSSGDAKALARSVGPWMLAATLLGSGVAVVAGGLLVVAAGTE